MNDIHDLLRRQRVTPRRPLKRNFTNNILDIIDGSPRKRSFMERVHLPSIGELHMKLAHLPKVAAVTLAIVAAGSGTAAAYGAYHWLIPKIDLLGITAKNDDNKREFAVNIKDCGVMLGGQTADDGLQRYEVSPDAHLSDEQVIKVLKNSCDYQQILQLMNTRWHDPEIRGQKPGEAIVVTMPGAGGDNVLNDPSIGKITAIDEGHITIESKVYKHFNGPSFVPYKEGDPIPDFDAMTDYYPDGKLLTRTFEIKPDADAVFNGDTIPRSELKVGDTIVFMSEVKRTVLTTGSWSAPSSIKVAHIIKTTIDPDYVQPIEVGNPNIVNAIARLGDCQGNSDYLCLAAKSAQLRFQVMYASIGYTDAGLDTRFKGNEKYFRSDINMNSADGGKYYHSIEGRITSLKGAELTLVSRGKAQTFKATLPYDVVNRFNQDKKFNVGEGDYIQISYLQKDDEDHTVIRPGDISGMSLLTRQLADGSFVKY